MEGPLRYRLATRLARRLRAEGRPLPLEALGEALGLRGPVEKVLLPLLDGRFFREEGVGLWEWRYPFPKGEAVAVLDLETTGLAPGVNEIMEVALLRLEEGRRLAYGSLVRTRKPPSPFVQRLTGIHPDELLSAPPLEAVLEEAYPLLQGATLVIHHAPFDLSFLRPALERVGLPLENPVVDSLRLARRAFKGVKRYGLDALSELLELPPRGVHRAMGDVERTALVLHEAYYILSAGRPKPLRDLGRFS
ncbi:DNA polymerase III, alpha subunit (gram-positive type) [Thermus oshimai JL-2]|uniref:DNA polymerase III, alpha subunit (Gram-positive type) n=1 Tax=Thermus oshimai JL-2 TaxID=751945 RepID=K7QVC3_THEOS|nr:3'-5' exonuclease [Thermus oshimai]AFV76431.1 DNA polymerase III, alpha subunit (gram-positive type) [Thermus oshimai JL-2]